ncbi:ABC transporter permease [Miltoncostaea marina]|uniref:ABC transporter permease n=1 Tax=Miltoncostaea marina TaxID=2843215 RepID=UPI001C3C66A8|nr:ABC transporter permease [Miltoncostaea marina]
MRLALREMRRRPGRFGVTTAILTLIALLLMFLGGLLDGLIAGSTGALRAQQADLIVYSDAAEESLVRSRLTPEERARVEQAADGARVAGLGSVQLGARLEGRGPRDLVPVVLFGFEAAPEGIDGGPPPDGRVYADDTLRAEGVDEGDVIRLGAARTPVEVVGFVEDSRYAGQGTLWGSLATWREVVGANRPGERVGDGVVQALVVGDGSGAAPAPEAIDRATGGATSTLTIDGAIDALPGVSQQRTVFTQIIGVTVIIALVVVALFFALITVERTALYGVLKAIGAGSGTLFAGVLLQALVVTLIASAIGVAASLAIDAALPAGSLPFLASPVRLAANVGYLVLAAAVGCAFSLRRVLRIDPARAIGGEQ